MDLARQPLLNQLLIFKRRPGWVFLNDRKALMEQDQSKERIDLIGSRDPCFFRKAINIVKFAIIVDLFDSFLLLLL